MSRNDFCACTPLEFTAVVGKWREHQEMLSRTGWEQARFMATAILQPYSTKTLRPSDVAEFAWDEKKDHASDVPKGTSSPEMFRSLLEKRSDGGGLNDNL